MKSRTIGILLAIATVLTLLWAASSAVASPPPAEPGGDVTIAGTVASKISYQGVLKENGSPVTGSRNMTFRLYSNDSCSTQVGSDIVKSGVQVSNGLFSVDLSVSQTHFNGQGLWLQVRVGGTKIGCEEILPVPYALSLKPGALILHEDVAWPTFSVQNGWPGGVWAATKKAISGWTSDGTALWGAAGSGTGVYGYSGSGTAIYAAGSGVIKSTAKSYIWISGNGVRPYHQSDSTIIDMTNFGGALIKRGADAGYKNVMLPITVPGPLYGQDVTISDLDIYWRGQTEFDGITSVILRRQTGVCSSSSCYASIVHDVGGPGYACEDSAHPEGCTLHYDTTSNNVLTSDSGILYLTVGLAFNSDTSWVQIGGVRLTLEHD